MDPVPYQITEEDVDEVLNAYEAAGGGEFPEDERAGIRRHVLLHVTELNEIVRTAPETDEAETGSGGLTDRVATVGEGPGARSSARRELALAAIEDLLIREGTIELEQGETRVFPITRMRDTERDDG